MPGKKVLIVDDSRTVRATLKVILEGQELELLQAEDGRKAVECATRDLPDLILMDVQMPEMDGLEACQRLRAQASTQHIPIILLTGAGEQMDVARGYESGCNLYLVKPVEPERLQGIVRRFLARSGAGAREASPGVPPGRC